MKNAFPFSIILLAILVAYSCQPTQQPSTPAQELYSLFQAIPPPDTLAIRLDSVPGESSQDISADQFLAAIDSSLLQKMIYEPDTFDFRAKAYWNITLDDQHDACLLGLKQVWFHFKYLLIYSKDANNFVDLLPVAYFYGGDGGQIMSESWGFDFESQPTIVTRQTERHLRWSETAPDEPEVILIKDVSMQQWMEGMFQEIPVQDSSQWVERFPENLGE